MIVSPCRTRAQNARTRRESSAKPTSTAIASTVSTNSSSRGCEAKNDRWNAGNLEKGGGLGNTPCVNAKIRIGIAIEAANPSSTANDEPIAGYVDSGTDV